MKRIAAEDVHVPEYAHEVPGGYPVHVLDAHPWDLILHVYAPILASPRPRVTSRGTFMPSDYRKHCERMAATLAYARGLYECGHLGELGTWHSGSPMRLDVAFWSPTQVGDLDNLAKTIMDAGQLHRGEEPGAELWRNDRQIRSLTVEWIPTDEAEWTQTVIRIKVIPGARMGLEAPKRTRGTRTTQATPKAQEGTATAQQSTRKGKASK